MQATLSALITGASSGIGAALAEALAAPGAVLHLGGRDAARLEAVAAACRARGAEVLAHGADVRDGAAMADWIGGAGQLDLVIANAGISGGTGGGVAEPAAQVRAILAVNLDGMLHTVLPAWAAMRGQTPRADGVRGRIAVIASLAGFVAFAQAPTYCASKAAADTWTVASAPSARREGVMLTSVCPGFVRTPMTAGNRFRMPGLIDADVAARRILRGIAAGRVRVAFPWWLALAAQCAGALPPALLHAAGRRRPGKAGLPDGD
jgi:short-subunit dehydrogenase